MSADIINLLNRAQQQIKELAADRDACLDRAKRAERKCVDQKEAYEVRIAKLTSDREKLLRIIEGKS